MRKNIIPVIGLGIALILNPLASIATNAPIVPPGAMLARTASVHISPFTDSKVLGMVSPRPCTVINRIIEEDGWLLVQFEDKQHQGWVQSSAIRMDESLLGRQATQEQENQLLQNGSVPKIDLEVEEGFIRPNPVYQ